MLVQGPNGAAHGGGRSIRARSGPRARHWRALVAASSLGCVMLAAAGCSGSGTAGPPPRTGPGFGFPLVADAPDTHIVDAPRGSLDAARLDLVSGTDTVLVSSADLGDRLFRVDTPSGAAQLPHATSRDGLVTVSLSDDPASGRSAAAPREVEIVLDAAVAWTVSLDGGATVERVDLGHARLSGLTFSAGASSITAVLPPPAGDVTVLMAGGASAYLVQAPPGVPARVVFGGGAGSAVVDGAARGGVPGGTVVSGPGWETAGKRYTFENSAGVSTFTLMRG